MLSQFVADAGKKTGKRPLENRSAKRITIASQNLAVFLKIKDISPFVALYGTDLRHATII